MNEKRRNGLSAFQKLFHSWNLNPFSTFLIESWHFEVHSRRFYMFLNWFARISFVIKKNKIELISILIFWSKSLGRDILGRDPSFFFNFKHLSIKIQILGQNSGHFYSMFISTKQQIRQIQDNCEKTGLSLSGHFRFSDLESPNQGKSERLGHLGIPDFGPSKNFGQSSKSRYKVDNF